MTSSQPHHIIGLEATDLRCWGSGGPGCAASNHGEMPPVNLPRRVELTVMVAMIMATEALGIDLMLPAFGAIRASFGLADGSTATARIVTAHFVAMAVGQLVFAVISDRFGRRRALHASLWLSMAAAMAAALAPSLPILLIARFAWGFAGIRPPGGGGGGGAGPVRGRPHGPGDVVHHGGVRAFPVGGAHPGCSGARRLQLAQCSACA